MTEGEGGGQDLDHLGLSLRPTLLFRLPLNHLLSTVPSLQTLCRLVIQRSVVHRLAIDGLHLPKGLKDFCKYE